ncbi:CPBP family intramembrane glutamic endopeptidase [Luteolibacter luteus]|uniref:CPBP family intramembrane metalloprotease n=1 Tax=Luteolibacter luteus TaxID=2728835 RepID=A0A858RIS1_9BACT|nr:CPBP family intramembrane glutamic endopeptidase [Luteolibacter luteus]QJE96615.1 CPBP family intramembrane metalloprotease [Luteolibacter luteus]
MFAAALVTAVSEIASAASAGPDLESRVILGTFILAGVLFAVLFSVRYATGTLRFSSPSPLLEPEAAAAFPAPAQGASLPPPLPQATSEPFSPYAWSPATAPAAPEPAPFVPDPTAKGLQKYFRVPIAHYRLFDLLFIGMVFLIYCGLTTGGGGGQEVPLEQKFKPEVLIASMFFQLLLMGMTCAFVVRRIKQSEWLGLRWKQWWLAIAIAPVTVFFVWGVLLAMHLSGFNVWLEQTLGIESMQQEAVKLLQEAKDPAIIILMGVAAVIIAPLTEEVVFRGYLYPAAKRFCGAYGAMIFSSLVFAAAHANAMALLPLFILAMLLCLIYELTGSIWATISVHFLFNLATVTLQLLVKYGIIDAPPPGS